MDCIDAKNSMDCYPKLIVDIADQYGGPTAYIRSPHLPPLPDSWRGPFIQMATECGLHPDFDAALKTVSTYWLSLPEKQIES